MTREQAAKILEVSPNARQREINDAYSTLCRQYSTRSRFATKPDERDAAANALKFLQEAYREMTGSARSNIPLRRRQPPPPSSAIPRRRLNARAVDKPAPSRRTRFEIRIIWPFPWLTLLRRDERFAAAAICAAMFVIAMVIVACV